MELWLDTWLRKKFTSRLLPPATTDNRSDNIDKDRKVRELVHFMKLLVRVRLLELAEVDLPLLVILIKASCQRFS